MLHVNDEQQKKIMVNELYIIERERRVMRKTYAYTSWCIIKTELINQLSLERKHLKWLFEMEKKRERYLLSIVSCSNIFFVNLNDLKVGGKLLLSEGECTKYVTLCKISF